MGFPRQEYWSGLPFPVLGDLLNTGIKAVSLASPALAGRFFTNSATHLLIIGRKWREILVIITSKSLLFPQCVQHLRSSIKGLIRFVSQGPATMIIVHGCAFVFV